MNTAQQIETPAAKVYLDRIAAPRATADGVFSLMLEILRAPTHYSDELNPTPGAIHHWEQSILLDVARSRRRDLQVAEMYTYDDNDC